MKRITLALIFGFILLPIALCAIVGEVLQGTGKLVGGVGEGVERLGEKLSITNQNRPCESCKDKSQAAPPVESDVDNGDTTTNKIRASSATRV